jgi:hypothetical protein
MTRLALLLALPLLACGDSTVAVTADGSSGGPTSTGSTGTGVPPTTGDITTGATGSTSGSGSDSETTGGSTGGATTSTSSSTGDDTTQGVDPSSTGGPGSTGTSTTGSTGDTTGDTTDTTGDTSGSTGDTTGEVPDPPPIVDAMCIANDLTTFAVQMPQAEELHVIGVYQATGNAITVDVGRAGVPLTLVLSSYEPVAFTLNLAPGVLLEHVILNGYEPHTVQGQGAAMVTDLSGQFNYLAACGYFWPMNDGGCDTPGLVMGAEQLTGLQLTSFAGCYEGASFSLD